MPSDTDLPDCEPAWPPGTYTPVDRLGPAVFRSLAARRETRTITTIDLTGEYL